MDLNEKQLTEIYQVLTGELQPNDSHGTGAVIVLARIVKREFSGTRERLAKCEAALREITALCGLHKIMNHSFECTNEWCKAARAALEDNKMMNSNEVTRMTSITDEQLQDIFEYHPWDAPKVERGLKVKLALKAAFKAIIEHVPPCPDRSAALRMIRDARMAANSAITHEGKY